LKKIFITGSNGFVGSYLKKYLNKSYIFIDFIRNKSILKITEDIVIHLAGKAHDLKNISSGLDYYNTNTELTKKIFDSFIISNANIFIFVSSVKAAADSIEMTLTEDYDPNPTTHYGKSKLFAEQYILNKTIPEGKRVYILRPCMIHGPGNKGNLNLLYKIISNNIPWPLGAFENKRSFCSVDNLCFVISNLIENNQIPSGIYNISDDVPVSTNDLIRLIAESQAKKAFILNIPKFIVNFVSKLGNILRLPLNTERLNKLTETYIVSNNKIVQALNKSLPVSSKEGLIKTLNTFGNSKSH